jgi:DNA mismatch repair protein MutS2
MVVTGPNTGGKTVALKTVGLLILMAQSGLHIPAHSGSEISIFRSIFADIGDEQSIEQSLSTFSSHITNIVRILHKADRRSLVILDELGAGTDPQEGAALARALLSFLLERGITTLVTTHHPELKAFAHSTPGVVNACVEFDLHSLRPTYHLTIGLPGRSNALAIAKRLGMFEEVIEAARKEISPDDQRAGAMLDEIHYQRDAARKARGAADRTKHETEKLSAELVTRLEHIEAERREILEQARLESESQIQTLKDELREVRQQLKHAHQPLEAVQQAEDKIEALEEASTQLSTPENELHPTLVGQPFDKRRAGRSTLNAQPATISIGSKVHLKTLNTQGIITALGEDEAEVQLGMLHIRVLLADLQPVGTQDVKEEKGVPGVERSALNVPPVVESPGTELDLRGRRAEDALIDLDRYLENAYMAGLLWVRIIHGKGTGKLRLAVRELLGQHPHVKSFEAGGDKEGGEGVTVAKLHSS